MGYFVCSDWNLRQQVMTQAIKTAIGRSCISTELLFAHFRCNPSSTRAVRLHLRGHLGGMKLQTEHKGENENYLQNTLLLRRNGLLEAESTFAGVALE